MKKKLTYFLIIFILMLPAAVKAQDGNISMMINPEIPAAGGQLNVTIFFNYQNPRSVNVISPPFEGLLTLKRSLRRSRVFESQMQTVFEFSFTVDTEERFTLEPFTLVYPGGRISTKPVIIRVRKEIEEQPVITQRLFWENAPGQVKAGERVTLTLRAEGWASPEPPLEFFLPEIPENAILAPAAVSPSEREGGIASKFTLIPLSAGNFVFSARTLQHGNVSFIIPALQINAAASADLPIQENTVAENTLKKESYVSLFALNPENKNKKAAKLPFFIFLFLFFSVIIFLSVCFTLKNSRN